MFAIADTSRCFTFPLDVWYVYAETGIKLVMVCPSGNSANLKKLSLIHAAGTYESRGRVGGPVLGSRDGLLFGKYLGTHLSQLSKMAGPPKTAPCGTPIALWLIGLFMLMSTAGSGRIASIIGLLLVMFYVLASRISS
jgi:hypothetical protein